MSQLPDNVLVLNLQGRNLIIYRRAFQNDLVTNNSCSTEMSDFWPPELWWLFLDTQYFVFLQLVSNRCQKCLVFKK